MLACERQQFLLSVRKAIGLEKLQKSDCSHGIMLHLWNATRTISVQGYTRPKFEFYLKSPEKIQHCTTFGLFTKPRNH